MHASQSTTTITPPPIPAAATHNDNLSSVLNTVDDASTLPVAATPPDPTSLIVAPPVSSSPSTSEVLRDAQMAEHAQLNGCAVGHAHNDVPVASGLGLDLDGDTHMADPDDVKPNGVHINGDVPAPSVEHLALQTPELNIPLASPSDSTAATRPAPDDGDGDDQPPPTKRARMLSDADQASLTHVSTLIPIHRLTLILFVLPGKWYQWYNSPSRSAYTSLLHPSPCHLQPTTV